MKKPTEKNPTIPDAQSLDIIPISKTINIPKQKAKIKRFNQLLINNKAFKQMLLKIYKGM